MGQDLLKPSRAALAALLTTTFLTAAQAQTGPSGAGGPAPVAARLYEIPAGPLPQALTAFGLNSGLQISYAPETAEGLLSPGFSGAAAPEEALARILGGSGLRASYPGGGSVLIEPPLAPASTPVSVSASPAPSVFLLEPITLYGARVVDRLDEARASVAVVQGDPIAAPAAATWRESLRRMANVSPGDWASDGFVIRGVNSEGLVPGGANAPLATFTVDGVEQTLEGTRRGTRGMFDVEQVEVYRGPQSTLSGRAALAGAVYLRTKDPEFHRSGAAQLTFGEDKRRQVGLAYGDHVGDRVAFRLSGEWSDKESDLNYPSYERFEKFKDFVSDDYYNFRGKLLILPTGEETTRVLVSASHAFDSPDSNDVAGTAWATGAPGREARRGDLFGPELLPDLYKSFGLTELPLFHEARETKVNNLGLEITHDFSESLRLTSLTGFSRSVTDRASVNFGTPGEFFQTEGEFTQSNLTQELRLNADSGPLRWTLGAYAARADNDAHREGVSPYPFIFPPILHEQTRNEAEILNLAAFGEASYEFAPGLRAIAGGRLDHIRQDQTALIVQNGFTTTDSRSEFRDTAFLPKLGLEYDLTEDQTLAFVYQHGYRPGGASVRAGEVYDYDPETTRNYELSWRGRFLDGRLGLGANVFYQDWRDQQIELLANPTDPASGFIANAGRSTSYGGELEASFAPTDKLELYASAGLLRTEFKDLNLTTWGVNYSGMDFPNAPEASLAAGFRWGGYEGPFASGSAKYVSSSLSRLEAPHFLTGEIEPPRRLDGRVTVDAEIGYAWEGLKLTAYAANLFDEEYLVYDSAAPAGMSTLGDRRELGLRLDYRF